MLQLADKGFPVTKTQLLDSVEILIKQLKRPNNFTDGRPGTLFFKSMTLDFAWLYPFDTYGITMQNLVS